MPPITALLHTANDALRLGRTLEMLLPCAQSVIVDHHSSDGTRRVARQYGALIVAADDRAEGGAEPNCYLDLAQHDWILCMQPGESISESLQASLFEWSALPHARVPGGSAFSVFVREQTIDKRWLELPVPETRLVPRSWAPWRGRLPAPEPSAIVLEGEVLRFALP
jgi:hypothetical protein